MDPAQLPKDATAATADSNEAVRSQLDFSDRRDFERARRGLIAEPHSTKIPSADFPAWDLEAFSFLDGAEAPATVNPSLWRQGQLNNIAGLFEVADGFYQVRGFDLSNVTFVAGSTGWIVIDPLTSRATAQGASELVEANLGSRPIHAVIYTHSHIDHFGGVRGIIDDDDVASGRTRVIAPEGFLSAAVSENVVAGVVMGRRASYMYGPLLPRGPRGHVDAGLGKTTPLGQPGLIAPTETISETGTELVIDGVRIVFQNTPGTEAPAEMNFHFPDRRVLCMAENCTATLHNLYTPRGAQVRDALAWSKYIQESIQLFGSDTDTLFASHHWPRWGRDDVLEYLAKQRDLYRYLHDQTMRLANHGLTMDEIAEEVRLPPDLGDEFFNRSYYGTVNHNVKAVYQRYLGWFDGNPAHLHSHPPVEAARRYVEFMGGSQAVLTRAAASYEAGDYRWVAEVVNHVVFAEPDNAQARHLQADALEQLGYQAESGPWRSFYLTGAQELRYGVPDLGPIQLTGPDVVAAMSVEMLLDYLAVRLNGPAATGLRIVVDLHVVGDDSPRWRVVVEHATLHAVVGADSNDATVTLRLRREALAGLVMGTTTLDDTLSTPESTLDGDRRALDELMACLDTFNFWFPIVTP